MADHTNAPAEWEIAPMMTPWEKHLREARWRRFWDMDVPAIGRIALLVAALAAAFMVGVAMDHLGYLGP